nr:hypothetical protein [Tanacetum cinerariifolium]
MAHQQLVADVYPDELCPPNKRKALSLTLDDFKTIFHLPQATDNNHDSFVPPPSFYDMIIFYKNYLGFTMELKTPSSFKTTGIHYSLLHSTSLIPYPRFTNIISGHYKTNFPEISRRARDKYHNLKDDDLMKNIFNSRRYKDKVGIKIPDWMISEEMKQTKHYQMYSEVFGIDVPLIQSPLTKSTQGTHRTPSAPRSPNPKVDATPVLTVDKADELILQDTLQVSLAENKSRKEKEARENVALVEKHLAYEEIEKMLEGQEHVVDDSSIPRNDEHNIPGTREKGKNVEESRITPLPTPIRSRRIHTDLVSSNTEKLQEFPELQGRYGYLFEHLRAKFMPRKSFVTLADHLYKAMADSLPTMVDKHIKEHIEKQVPEQMYLSMKDDPQWQQQDIAIWLALQMKFERLQVLQTTCRTPAIPPRDQDDPHDDAHPEGEKSAKRQKTSEYETYTDSYASDDDEILTKQVSQDIMEEVSLNVDESKLKKIADEMLRQRCTSGDKHQYHIDQMKNLLKSDIVWESRKEILVSPHPRKTTPLVLSCQRDPEAPTLSLINQDLLYLREGNSRPEKIVLSLHKFPTVVFNDDDIKE